MPTFMPNAFGKPNTDIGNCSCLHGTPYIDINGNCGCDNGIMQTYAPVRPPIKTTRNPAQIDYSNPRIIAQAIADAKQPVYITQAANGTSFDFMAFVQNNKWLLLGGAAVLAYFLFFSGGLTAGSKVRTDVTKWGV